ncbi:hypothetical protein AVEN_33436-1 [Araneus ventricosus]|uniref:C-type lectin domain-containing protein n=1 Tax=Araneus ventricosus TaxID=182803 RepID=A0A4Y2IT04_ARAVE|nr:hypothetical protein AVEN_33436-1 [Araneus ventricosus]
MPDCEGMQDKCQCHPSFTSYKINAIKHQRNCLKMFPEKKIWDVASKTCSNEFSALAYNRIPDSFFEDFRNRGVNLIWLGIRKRLGNYIVEGNVEHVFNLWTSNYQGWKWEGKELSHDCFAFNISSGYMVTQNCNTELEYVCENFGFPVYPLSKNLKEYLGEHRCQSDEDIKTAVQRFYQTRQDTTLYERNIDRLLPRLYKYFNRLRKYIKI